MRNLLFWLLLTAACVPGSCTPCPQDTREERRIALEHSKELERSTTAKS